MRKPSRSVELDDIISNQILGDNPEVIALVMRIHLALEAVLIEIIQEFQTDDGVYRLSFPRKTLLLFTNGKITEFQKRAFDRLNDFRNDFAHIFGHRVSLKDTLKLARDLELCRIDFSDSAGCYTEAEATEFYGGMIGILEEVGWNILHEAASILVEAGGRDIFVGA